MSDVFWLGLGTITATFVGPIAAVIITRFIDYRRDRYNRRVELFRILIKSQKTPLSFEHVSALNLIEVEFYNVKQVINAWHILLNDFNEPINNNPEDEAKIIEKRDYHRAELLSAMAKLLRFNIPDLRIFRGGYVPKGWVDDEMEIRQGRRFVAEIAAGRKAIPVIVTRHPSKEWDNNKE